MALCELCEEQAKKGRYTEPHTHLIKKNDQRLYRGAMTGGYEEQDYVCKICNAEFTYSNDKNDIGWILHHKDD